ncbi:MAG: DUF1508 domain-containing protein [Lewinellaceae bacterium]|nr:DUF1508 domain-containing protein [Lewinellaceae bacterium]
MNIQNITKLFDLEYFDGPLLSLFADANGNFYLYKWYDVASGSHQWLVFSVKYETLLKYLNAIAPEFELLNDEPSKPFYLVEFSEKGQPHIVRTCSQNEILDEYQSLKTVFFTSDLCPNWKAVQHFFGLIVEKHRHFHSRSKTRIHPETKFHIVVGKGGDYFFNLIAHNGQILYTSDGYKSKQSAINGIESVRNLVNKLGIEVSSKVVYAP